MQFYWMWATMGLSYKVYGDQPDWNQQTIDLFDALWRDFSPRVANRWWD